MKTAGTPSLLEPSTLQDQQWQQQQQIPQLQVMLHCYVTISNMYYLHAAPSGIPGSLNFSDVNLTSITVQWTELPCSDRNGEITGYTVEYSSTTPPPHTNTVTVSGSSNTRLVVGGLLPRTSYNFSLRAQGAANTRSGTRFTATPTGCAITTIPIAFYINSCRYRFLFQRESSS